MCYEIKFQQIGSDFIMTNSNIFSEPITDDWDSQFGRHIILWIFW